MQLKKLTIDHFVGIDHAELPFERPVTLLVGTNNQGKSSVRDAVQFALTGKARAMRFAKEVGNVIHGGNGMAVELDYLDGSGEISIRRTKTNIGSHVDERAVLRYCLNPQEFIALAPKERARILSDVLGGGLDEVIKAAIIEHVGEIDDTVLAEIKGSGVNLLDVDALRNQVVEQRRSYKRLIEELPDKAPLLGDYELNVDYDLAKDEAALKTLADRIKKGGDLIAAARKMVETKGQIVQLEGELKKIKDGHRDVPNLPRGVSKDKLNMAPIYMSIQEAMLGNSDSNQCECPVCPNITDRKAIQKAHDDLAKWYETYHTKLEERQAIIEENNRLDFEHEVKSKLLEEAKARLKVVDVPKGGEELLAELQAERDTAQKRIAKHQLWQAAIKVFQEAGEKRTKLTALVAECNRIDEALKDGGPVKSAIAAGGRKLPINESLLEAWGMKELSWSDSGEISLRDLPIEYASKSEQSRAACVMALALAEVSGIGIAAIDEEFDALVEENRNKFFEAITECHLRNVLVCASTQKDYRGVELPDWLDVFVVEQGRVARVS